MKIKQGLTYDDVLLKPKKSAVKHRSDINLIIDWGKDIKTVPIVCANMKHVVNFDVAKSLSENSCMSLLHRFEEGLTRINSFGKILKLDKGYQNFVGTSFGANKDEIDLFKKFYKIYGNDLKIVCIDIAHGHSDICINAVKDFKDIHPDSLLIAGNVATSEGAYDLWKAGADVVKCGIGSGCFAKGTRILMSNATYKNIEDVVSGDRIINKDGDAKTVLKSFSTGIKKVSRLSNSIFYKDTFVTKDHKYFVYDVESSKSKWQEIGKTDNILLLMPRFIIFEIPETFDIAIGDLELKPSYDLGYIFGIFLGSGKIVDDSIHFLAKEFINRDLEKSVKNIFNKDLSYNENFDILTDERIINFFSSFGNEKILPNNLLVNNKEYLTGILNGLINTKNIEFNSNILELFNIANYLVTGIFPNNKNISRHRAIFSHNCAMYINNISKILEFNEDEFETEVFDLTIDDDTHSFIADNAIVHNSICSTRIETGHGVPQLTALDDIWEYMRNFENRPRIIADGGLSKTGNIVKALCLSDAAMLGNMLAGTEEGPGDIVERNGRKYKTYAGSSTFKANNVEGYSGLVPYKGSINDIIKKIKEGVQSGCSYQGVYDISDLQNDPEFILITNAGVIESGAHDLIF